LLSFAIVPPCAKHPAGFGHDELILWARLLEVLSTDYKANGLCHWLFIRFYSASTLDYNLVMEDFKKGSLYELIGGEAELRALVDRFYDLMDSSPEAAKIRSFHPKSLKRSREKLFMFLSGWSGGPPLYVEKFGHPRLRMRHLPFSIGTEERDQWLWCMCRALDESRIDPRVVEFLKARFAETADFMRNEEG